MHTCTHLFRRLPIECVMLATGGLHLLAQRLDVALQLAQHGASLVEIRGDLAQIRAFLDQLRLERALLFLQLPLLAHLLAARFDL
jgi:hypothetical protein